MSTRIVRCCIVVVVCLLAAAGVASAAGKAKRTHGTVWAGPTHIVGENQLIVPGDFSDSRLGKGAIVYVTTAEVGPTSEILVKAKKITIYTRKGSLQGKGQAIQTFNPDGSGDITDGKFSLTKGTGAYKGHTFKGTFDGSYLDGVYTFHYNAVYK